MEHHHERLATQPGETRIRGRPRWDGTRVRPGDASVTRRILAAPACGGHQRDALRLRRHCLWQPRDPGVRRWLSSTFHV